MTDRTLRDLHGLNALSFWENGLLPVVVQDSETGAVLMVAFANRDALEKTLTTGQMHYWSRSRQELWHKGATSGNYQDLVSLHMDCDADTLLARVRQRGPACHTGEPTCFGRIGDQEDGADGRPAHPSPSYSPEDVLPGLWARIEERASRTPEASYTVRLMTDENLRLKKLGEELAELIVAMAREDRKGIPMEAADLVYHLLVALKASGSTLNELLNELGSRMS
jgi:phosphoribosyl-ATP pyrophosphohydrolase/phosphoribosyl-AMP cyclohydrolase